MNSQRAGAGRGIYDGFEGYITATNDDYGRVLTEGMVVPDTNVLLNLYRYHERTRTDLFAVLRKVRYRLWVPDQVLAEFWGGRESAIRDTLAIGTKAIGDLEECRDQSVQRLREWTNRIALPETDRIALEETLRKSFESVTDKISARQEVAVTWLDISTQKDPILPELNAVIKGHIGDPMTEEAYAAALAEGQRRLDKKIAPAYMDKGKKTLERAVGDYLVWEQVVQEAEQRKCDILIVTGDVKEDWWRKEQGQARGPHLDLVRELLKRAGTRLYMMRPETFLIYGKQSLRVKVSEESVQDVERVERFLAGDELPAARYSLEKLPEGRGGNYLHTVVEMTRLAEGAPNIEVYLDDFQERFPTITLRDEARRRMRNLQSLGLADIIGHHVTLTPVGRQLIGEPRVELLQDRLLTRIAGAAEIRELATHAASPSELRNQLRESPPAGLSQTQATLVLRWLDQLGLV